MTTSDTPLTGLCDLINHYKAEPDKTGNLLATRMCGLLTHHAVRNKIAKAAGGYASQISISLDDLVDEVRQEAVVACMAGLVDPKFEVRSDEKSAQYIFNAALFAAYSLVDRHLGSKTGGGTGRSKGLSTSPLKWDSEDKDKKGCAATRAAEDKLKWFDPALSPSDIDEYMDRIQESDLKIHRCLSLLLDGYTQIEAAKIMGISDRTVRNYLEKARLFAKG